MPDSTFKLVKTIFLADPDFMPIFLQPCGPDHVIAVQTWCAFLIDVEAESAKRIDYPAWAWNVSSAHSSELELTIYFERLRELKRCRIDPATGKIDQGELIPESIVLPGPQPPHLVTDEAIWFAHGGRAHTLVAARYDRTTDLVGDISRISSTDFFLVGPDGTVYLHRWDVGLILPHPVDQPEVVVNYRMVGCSEPRGAAFDDRGVLWIMDEDGPRLFEANISERSVKIHEIARLHKDAVDPRDPSPYPWHSCIWCKGRLVVGCCDAARVDILRPSEPRASASESNPS